MKMYVSNYFDICEIFSQFYKSYDVNFIIFFWSLAIKKNNTIDEYKICIKNMIQLLKPCIDDHILYDITGYLIDHVIYI